MSVWIWPEGQVLFSSISCKILCSVWGKIKFLVILCFMLLLDRQSAVLIIILNLRQSVEYSSPQTWETQVIMSVVFLSSELLGPWGHLWHCWKQTLCYFSAYGSWILVIQTWKYVWNLFCHLHEETTETVCFLYLSFCLRNVQLGFML